ncbi:Kae1-like domain-containing protein [Symbiobacterium terraclitae]|uniref:Kae1-like domain-containing protein n=1 Tax=Symbiobacterium terraclitae TaxID=557451 RepID=UPI0035B56FA0
MQTRLFLGIDTSYYTCSLALVDEAGRLLEDQRRPLAVALGERGVAPQEAVWAHLNALPQLAEPVLRTHGRAVAAVAASVKPRPVEGSYLPPFRVGEGFGRALAAALSVPFYPTTHQEMHIQAGLWSADKPPQGHAFLAVHLSGGTTELVRVTRRPGGFAEELLGGTQDLHAGQFVDRVGVALGLPFPAGPHLERLAASGVPGRVALPSAVRGYTLSFSGPESAAQRLVGKAEPADLALAVLHAVARSLEKWLLHAMEETGLREVLVVGGVAANQILRERLRQRLEHPAVGARLAFAQPQYSTDNAVGTALLAREIAGAAGVTG